jgi:hypothetical protein
VTGKENIHQAVKQDMRNGHLRKKYARQPRLAQKKELISQSNSVTSYCTSRKTTCTHERRQDGLMEEGM